MNFHWDQTQSDMYECQEIFNEIGPEEAIFMTHYELAAHELSTISADTWKQFLTNRNVAEWITEELDLFNQAQIKKIIKTATDDRRSVGAAQMINALNKNANEKTTKEGPAFIYSYVPLNHEEVHANNVHIETQDIFWEDDLE